jgi:UDP-N-acetylmuramate dehydrogenase
MIALYAETTSPLIAAPGRLRGRLIVNARIGRQTWFGVGGPAEMLYRPADCTDLSTFLAMLPPEVPIMVLGGGSNLLIRDGGLPGVTIRLGRNLAGIAIDGDEVVAGAGALHLNVALAAAKGGIAGLEFLSGIPGTIGGGLRMNAGAYGRETKDVLVSATALDRNGLSHLIAVDSMRFSYRHCGVDQDWIFVEARLRGDRGDPATIARRMAEIRQSREATQPIRSRTGGSTFKNPLGDTAWRLIDLAGCRGLVRGGATVSPQHANFLINSGDATAADLEGLGEEVRRRVREATGVVLEWEIRRVGRPLPGIEAVVQGALER